MRRYTLPFLILAALGVSGAAQTIPELARTKPENPVVRGVMGDTPPLPITELVSGADVVLEGRLERLKSYLTPDEMYILTDYHIRPTRIFAGRLPVVSAERPGPIPPLILTVRGGEYTQDGFTVYDVDHTREALQHGGYYLLFLKGRKNAGQYTLYYTGAFEIEKERLKPILRQSAAAYSELIRTPYDKVVHQIETAALKR